MPGEAESATFTTTVTSVALSLTARLSFRWHNFPAVMQDHPAPPYMDVSVSPAGSTSCTSMGPATAVKPGLRTEIV